LAVVSDFVLTDLAVHSLSYAPLLFCRFHMSGNILTANSYWDSVKKQHRLFLHTGTKRSSLFKFHHLYRPTVQVKWALL